MITTEKLLKISSNVTVYGDLEAVNIKKPIGVDPLPDEWAEKLGTHEFDPPAAYEIPDVHLCGPALVGIHEHDVILDAAYFGRIDLWERNKPYWIYAQDAYNNSPGLHKEYAVSFVNVWSNNYFHWVLDIMPSLEFILTLDEKPLIIIPQNSPHYMTDTLDEMGLKYEALRAYHYFIERLLVVPTRREQGFVRPSAIRYLQKFAQAIPPTFTSPYIYTSRNDASSRQVVNERDVIDYLGSFGYYPVQAGKHSFVAQQRMFELAQEIVGAHGSALANMVWSDAPRVIELVSPEYTNPCCWLIAAGMGWDYGYVIGDPSDEGHEFISIDINKLQEVLERMQ